MTATPEGLLDEVMAFTPAAHFADWTGTDAEWIAAMRQAVEAYGRACRIEELRRMAEARNGSYLISARIAELEQGGRMNERQQTHYVGDDCEPDGHRTDAAGVDFDIVIPPPPHDYRVHDHGQWVHAHYVRIDQPEHDHRAG